jgi:hypothetical protein
MYKLQFLRLFFINVYSHTVHVAKCVYRDTCVRVLIEVSDVCTLFLKNKYAPL